jgi:hypothetical protein
MLSIDLANQKQKDPDNFAKLETVDYKYNADADSTYGNSKNAHGLSRVTNRESNSPSNFMATFINGGAESGAAQVPDLVDLTTALDEGLTLDVGIPKFTQPEGTDVSTKTTRVITGFDLKTKVCFDKLASTSAEAYHLTWSIYLITFFLSYSIFQNNLD